MHRLHCEMLLGDITGCPINMRPNLEKMGKGSFLEMMLVGKPTTNPEADYLYVCLFERSGKQVREVHYPGYMRQAVRRTPREWKPFKAKESSMVILNQIPVKFPLMQALTVINYAGICDYTGKIFCFAPLENPFMGRGGVYFGQGNLIIRMV